MSFEKLFYPESRFGGFTDVDGTIAFFVRVNALLKPSFTVLDVGCGRGEYKDDPVEIRRNLRVLKGKVKKVIGLDVDKAGIKNPYLNKFIHLKNSKWSLKSSSVDLIVCDCVVEHLINPKEFFNEANRVLKKGGLICIRTPNAWGYVAMAARLVPNRFHSRVTSVVQSGRKEQDVFPTIYRCNTLFRLRSMMKKCGFDATVYSHEAEPAYLSFSKIIYGMGVLFQKFAPSYFRNVILAFGKKSKKHFLGKPKDGFQK